MIIQDITKSETNNCFIIDCFDENNDKPSQGTWIDIVTENHALREQPTDKSVICKQITVSCTDVQN